MGLEVLMLRRAVLLGGFVMLVIGLCVRWRLVRWGAADEDLVRPMPGDDLVARPTVVTHRAVTIEAAPDDVWPWLVQMGDTPRAGYYSYEPVERVLGMKVENAGRILPEYQQLAVGDALDAGGNMRVRAIEEGRALVLGPPPLPHFDSTWAMALYAQPDGTTRLVSRVRCHYKRWTPGNVAAFLVLDFGQLVMERKWLLGVRDRAERLARERAALAPTA
jgi:hypothetical protein